MTNFLNDVTPEMALITALDRNACVRLSPYTGKWYVEAKIDIGDGVILTGIAEHEDSIHLAVKKYLERLINIKPEEYIATQYEGQRREYRWNGSAFVECTRPEVLNAND